MSLKDKASIVLSRGAQGQAGQIDAWNPNGVSGSQIVSLGVTQATTNLTRVNESGLIESVSANVLPRDFVNGGCGEFNIWPERTNREPNSNNFLASVVGGTITPGQESPTAAGNEGNLLNGDGTSVQPRSGFSITFASAGECVISIRAKAGTNDSIALGFQSFTLGSGTAFSFFDLSAGTTPTSGAKIRSLGNGWYQCESAPYTVDAGDLSGVCTIFNTPDTSNLNWPTAGDSNGQNVLLYEFQAEEGSFATAVIPTSGSAETRDAILVSQSGLSALLGQSEGGIYAEIRVFNPSVSTTNYFSISDGTVNNYIGLGIGGGQLPSTIVVSKGTTQASLVSSTSVGTSYTKIMVRYGTNIVSLNQDGITEATDNSVVLPTSFNHFGLGVTPSLFVPFFGSIRNLTIFNNLPTEAQANALTT